jgi:hypothetical protein
MSAAFDYVIVIHGSGGCKRGRFAIVFVLRYPFIRVFEYSAFRKVLPELPDTYAKWQAELKRKKARECRAYVGAGFSFEEHNVEVNCSSFLAYCEERRESPTVSFLYLFASEQQG